MKFQDLTEEAQAAALDKLRDINVEFDWWTCSYEYFVDICSSFGLDIYKIYFSGFWSQGDGASFEGDFEWKEPDFSKIPDAIASSVQTLKEQSALVRTYDSDSYLIVGISQSGTYYHENTMSFEVTFYDSGDDDDVEAMEMLLDEEGIKDAFRDIARWFYSCLEDEYEYLTSDEAIKETIDANDYEFDEDGNLA